MMSEGKLIESCKPHQVMSHTDHALKVAMQGLWVAGNVDDSIKAHHQLHSLGIKSSTRRINKQGLHF